MADIPDDRLRSVCWARLYARRYKNDLTWKWMFSVARNDEDRGLLVNNWATEYPVYAAEILQAIVWGGIPDIRDHLLNHPTHTRRAIDHAPFWALRCWIEIEDALEAVSQMCRPE